MPNDIGDDLNLQAAIQVFERIQQNLIEADKLARKVFDTQGDDLACVRRELEREIPGLDDPAILSVLRQLAERGECRMLARVFAG